MSLCYRIARLVGNLTGARYRKLKYLRKVREELFRNEVYRAAMLDYVNARSYDEAREALEAIIWIGVRGTRG